MTLRQLKRRTGLEQRGPVLPPVSYLSENFALIVRSPRRLRVTRQRSRVDLLN